MTQDLALKQIIEGAIMAADQPLSIDQMLRLFTEDPPNKTEIRSALSAIGDDCEQRGFELKEVANGYRFQVRSTYGEWVSRLWAEKAPRYTRAFLETLVLIAYKQPLTRGDIEEIRGVSVSTNIIRSLLEREWVRIVGHRDVPGRPALFATTKTFLDYFNLSSLDELPSLSEIREIEEVNEQLELEEEPEQGRSIELEVVTDITSAMDSENAIAHIGGDLSSEDDIHDGVDSLEEVTQKVNAIQENIRSMFHQEEHEDEPDEDDDDFDDRE